MAISSSVQTDILWTQYFCLYLVGFLLISFLNVNKYENNHKEEEGGENCMNAMCLECWILENGCHGGDQEIRATAYRGSSQPTFSPKVFSVGDSQIMLYGWDFYILWAITQSLWVAVRLNAG